MHIIMVHKGVVCVAFQSACFKFVQEHLINLTRETFRSTVAHTVIGTVECVGSETALTDCS